MTACISTSYDEISHIRDFGAHGVVNTKDFFFQIASMPDLVCCSKKVGKKDKKLRDHRLKPRRS
jgi:hypothetical protein